MPFIFASSVTQHQPALGRPPYLYISWVACEGRMQIEGQILELQGNRTDILFTVKERGQRKHRTEPGIGSEGKARFCPDVWRVKQLWPCCPAPFRRCSTLVLMKEAQVPLLSSQLLAGSSESNRLSVFADVSGALTKFPKLTKPWFPHLYIDSKNNYL